MSMLLLGFWERVHCPQIVGDTIRRNVELEGTFCLQKVFSDSLCIVKLIVKVSAVLLARKCVSCTIKCTYFSKQKLFHFQPFAHAILVNGFDIMQ